MRNPELDIKIPEDVFIGELIKDGDCFYRFVCGLKIKQVEELTQDDIDLNLIVNRMRVRGDIIFTE